jgi:hypothetical protein
MLNIIFIWADLLLIFHISLDLHSGVLTYRLQMCTMGVISQAKLIFFYISWPTFDIHVIDIIWSTFLLYDILILNFDQWCNFWCRIEYKYNLTYFWYHLIYFLVLWVQNWKFVQNHKIKFWYQLTYFWYFDIIRFTLWFFDIHTWNLDQLCNFSCWIAFW